MMHRVLIMISHDGRVGSNYNQAQVAPATGSDILLLTKAFVRLVLVFRPENDEELTIYFARMRRLSLTCTWWDRL
jgi:hypothetical protein